MAKTIRDIIHELWEKHFVRIPVNGVRFFDSPMVKFNIIHGNVLDIVVYNYQENIGFINLERSQDHYQIQTPWELNCHPGLDMLNGAGVEVREEYQGRNYGHFLLSLGIGTAQLDHRLQERTCQFQVMGHGLGDKGKDGKDIRDFYTKFGFRLISATDRSTEHVLYDDPVNIPEIRLEL